MGRVFIFACILRLLSPQAVPLAASPAAEPVRKRASAAKPASDWDGAEHAERTSADVVLPRFASIVYCPDGTGGIQSLPPSRLRMDEDGDMADEFIIVGPNGKLLQRR